MAWNCLPSCIGSLPHTDPIKAVDLVLKAHCGTLLAPVAQSRLWENMYIQYATYLLGSGLIRQGEGKVDLSDYDPEEIYTNILSDEVDAFALPPENFSGFYELMSAPFPIVLAVKGR